MRTRYLIQHVGSQVEFGMQVVFSSLGGMITTIFFFTEVEKICYRGHCPLLFVCLR